jgi:predicted DCC family thiol-disulfide oxidoreductase YuxK
MPDPAKPVLIYDGRCGFCGIWIEYWRRLTGDAVEYAASQEAAARYPQISAGEFQKSVQLVMPSGEILHGAHAVFQSLAFHPSQQWLLAVYRRVPGIAAVTEASYRFIARHRDLFYWITVLLFGRAIQPLRFDGVQWLFRKCLALIWLIAFASFGAQAAGLIGSGGIQPASLYLARVAEYAGSSTWRVAPTIFWAFSGEAFVRAACVAGAVCAALAFLGVFWRAALLLAFVLYLSLVNVSQEFLSYQWDILLLETGFLSIFLGYSRAVVWLFRWLLFRLMFLSGAVKLLSGDAAWRSLTALLYHYQTQPIPTPLAWYAQQLPVWFQKGSCFLVLFIELAIPFLILGPRRCRRFAAPWLLGLQAMILVTGNYAFFNWLAIALCLFLFDDAWLARFLPARWLERAERANAPFAPPRVRAALSSALLAVIGILSGSLVAQTVRGDVPAAARALVAVAAPFGVSSSYGLFAVMTTTRPEIVIEGSNDGVTWLEYEFKYKPGRLDRPPPWVAPHQPRLDWQMWFAALGSYQENVWLVNTLARLLQNAPEVLALIGRNPFPEKPPRLIRAQLYDYRFTNWAARSRTGNWWARTPLGPYVRPVSLENLSALPLLQWKR